MSKNNSTTKNANNNTLWSKLTAPQLREAITMFQYETDMEHISFDEFQKVVDVNALAEWIEWEYSEILMLRQESQNTMRAEALDFEVK